MPLLPKVSSFFRNLLGRRSRDRQLDEELESYVEHFAEKKVRAGLSPQEARRQALIELGGKEPMKEKIRERRIGHGFDTLLQDIRYGLRMLRKNKGFTLVAVVTLALGIGANTAIFSAVNTVLLRPLPYADPDSLVAVWETFQKRGSDHFPLSFPNYRDWKERNQVFEKFALFHSVQVNLTTEEGTDRLPAARVTAEFLPALGVTPLLGRTFTPADDVQGAEPVVLLSHDFWQRRFGGDSGIVGRRLTINGAGTTVIGVLPASFEFPIDLANAEIWTPAASDAGYFSQRNLHAYTGLARLRPNVTVKQAQAEMSRIAAQLEQEHSRSNEGKGANILSLQEQIVGESRLGLLLLLGVTGFVLLIACTNVANLLMARSAARQREFAIRTALGADRAHLIRQLLTESSLLAIGGGALGTILAPWVVQGIRALVAAWDVPRLSEVSIDGSVLAFTIAVSLMSAVLFGLAPALQSPQLALYSSLKEGLSYSPGGSRRRLRNALVILEVALAIVLLLGAGLLLRSFLSLLQVQPGFNTEGVLTFRLIAPSSKLDTFDQVADFHRQVETHIAALPGVLSSGASDRAPLAGGRFSTDFWILGRMNPDAEEGILFHYYSATPDYFRTLGIPLLRGRLFTEEDRRYRPGVVLINQSMAQRYWPGGNPLGDSLMLGVSFGQDGEPETFEVVGVVGDVKQTSLDAEVRPQIYIPYRQQTGNRMYFVVRTEGDPLAQVGAIRAEVTALDRDVPLYEVSTMETLKARSTASHRVGVLLLGGFAVLALALAMVGLYGVISYSVNQRTHEMGIRMAMGARRTDILKLVVRQGMLLVLVGAGFGLAGALVLTRFLQNWLFGITATDPLTFGITVLLLGSIALLACWVPARRAMKVDPMVALRYE